MSESAWKTICSSEELVPMFALFRVNGRIFGLSAIDPFSNAAVLSRGIVGDLKGKTVVASPLFKQHFDLDTGFCLEDDTVSVKTYDVREVDKQVQVLV